MNKEILQEGLEREIVSRCKNCGADLIESGTSTAQKSVGSSSVEAIHVVCNKCGYIQVIKAVA